MTTFNQYKEEREKLLKLLWGEAPEGSLKYEKGQDISNFHNESLSQTYKYALEAVIEKAEGIKKPDGYELKGVKSIYELEQDGYNSALDSLISWAKEEISKINK